MSDTNPAPRVPEMRKKRQRLREVNERIVRMREELSTLKSERQQLKSEIPKRAPKEGSPEK